MTGKFNIVKTSKIYKTDHTQFGGYVYDSDFNTDYRGKDNIHGSTIANRIICDQKFDEQCRKNTIFRNGRNEEC